MRVVTAAEMRRLDHLTIETHGVPSLRLMERAGQGVVDVILKRWTHLAKRGALVVAGKGNNGGDGLVIARLLHEREFPCEVACIARAEDLSPDAAANLERFRAVKGLFTEVRPGDLDNLRSRMQDKGMLVDALLGTGLRSPVEGFLADVVELMNASGLPIIAVDTPSGLDSDRGTPLGATIQAEVTVTFGFPKTGQVIYPGVVYSGDLVVADIGIHQQAVAEVASSVELLDPADVVWFLPRRADDSHKGSHGHLLVMAGSRGKTGAAVLGCRAAMRVGTGLVTLAAPRGLNEILAGALVESMTEPLGQPGEDQWPALGAADWHDLAERKSAVLFGPGVGVHDAAQTTLDTLLEHCGMPWLIDADGLNNLAADVSRLREARVPPVLTPHPGEMSRLTGLDTADVNGDRVGIARAFAVEHRCHLVLKGARTVMATPEGQVSINPTGNSGMASGGMGDVLAGMVAGFLAQGVPPEDAVRLGVYLHGRTGDRVADDRGGVGLIASDLVEELPRAIKELAQIRELIQA